MKFRMTELVPSRPPVTARLGAGTGSSNQLTDDELGKAVKLVGESRYGLCTAGDAIEGFINSIKVATLDDYTIGSVAVGNRKTVAADGLEATPGTGTLAVGDYVVAGTMVAKDTALTDAAPQKVTKATIQPAAAPAAPAAQYTIAIPIALVDVTGAGDVLTDYIPGHAFKLIKASFAVGTPVTTASRLFDLVADIEATEVTGGLVAITSAAATPLGAVIAGSAITALNIGTAAEKISLRAESVTAFAEGTGYALLTIENTDTLDALKSANASFGEAQGWRVVSLGTVGTGAVDTLILIERAG